jgi:4-amino-4-deoxy-L-arabinose transferase-like glycosyltransferase
MSRKSAMIAMAALTALFSVLALREASNDSPTFDEPVNIAAGVTYLTRHDLRLNIEHPPLAKALEAIPVLLVHPRIPRGASWDTAPLSDFALDFYQQNASEMHRITVLSRLPGIVMAGAIAWLLYAIGARVASRRAGVIAGGLWLTTPLVLGHGHLAGLDIPLTLAVVGGALLVLQYADRPTPWRAAAVGAAGGAALLVRTTGLVVIPVLAIAVAFASGWRPGRRAVGHALLTLVVAWVALWAGYRALSPSPSAQVRAQYEHFHHCPADCPKETIADRALSILPVPIELRAGTRKQGILASVPHDGFMLGRHVLGTVWWFWPTGLLLKLSIPSLLALIAGPIGWLLDARRRRALALALGLPAVVLSVATVLQAAPVGVRYLLPAIALALPGGAMVVDRVLSLRWRWPFVLLAVLALGQAVSLADSSNQSLAWTTWPFRPGYRWVADSNLDWAQDLDGLRSFAREHHPWMAFDSPLILQQPVDQARPLRNADPATVDGWIAVGASTLTVYSRDQLAWLRGYCPVGNIGGTILLYHLERPPDVRPGPVQPVAPCAGREFSERRD